MNHSKNRLDHLSNKNNKDNTLAFEEAVMVWNELGIVARVNLAMKSSNDSELIFNIYKEYFNYGHLLQTLNARELV